MLISWDELNNKNVEIKKKIYICALLYNLNPIRKVKKADLIAIIAEKTGVPKIDVLVSLESFFSNVKETLAEGENIYIRGFGSFITKKRAAKVGRNIKKNTLVYIPEHYIPAFKPAKEFMDEVKKIQASNIEVVPQKIEELAK